MSQWYYVDGNKRHGPVEDDALLGLWRSGRLGLDTPVWREGEADWQPLERFGAELDLGPAGSAVPPPLPPVAPSARPAHPASSAPSPSGMSGCLIAAIVAAVLLVPATAILAAIALPAYQGYTLRARIASEVAASAPLRARVATHLAQYGSCPDNDDAGFGTPGSLAGQYTTSVTVGEFESNLCGMELVIGNTGNERIDGRALWLEYQPADGSWQCTSEIDDRYLPRNCRG